LIQSLQEGLISIFTIEGPKTYLIFKIIKNPNENDLTTSLWQ